MAKKKQNQYSGIGGQAVFGRRNDEKQREVRCSSKKA